LFLPIVVGLLQRFEVLLVVMWTLLNVV